MKLAAGASTAYQHDATVLSNGTISIFDNGAVPKVHQQSRGARRRAQPHGRAPTPSSPSTSIPRRSSSGSQGNVQVLANGDAFIGWGAEPYFSEFSAAGQLLFDAHMHGSYQSYRAYRFPWTGTPPSRPRSSPRPRRAVGRGDGLRELERRHPHGRLARARGTLAAAADARGKRSASGLRDGHSHACPGARDVAVQALDASGAVLGTSRTIAP